MNKNDGFLYPVTVPTATVSLNREIPTNFQESIYLLNDFCADIQSFSYHKLANLRFHNLLLHIDAEKKELIMVICNEVDYQALNKLLLPDQRLYQLLSIHFKKVSVAFGLQGETVDQSILLKKIALFSEIPDDNLRALDDLGARFRRALNVAMQGHISVLKLHGDEEAEKLRELWERGRIMHLIEKYKICSTDDLQQKVVKIWTSDSLQDEKAQVILIE